MRFNAMVKPVNIGAESFHELIESNSYYVDKIRQNPHHVNLP